jgi:Protein of unknown function (DUF1593)
MRSHIAGARAGGRALALAAILSAVLTGPAAAQAPGSLDPAGTPRVIVLSDIGNEPDDQMSFTRFLLYANRMSVEGLVATTSTWQRDEVRPDIMDTVIDHYGQVQPNLLEHASGYRTAAQLRALVRTGQPAYGMAAVGSDKMSPGAQQIIDAADRPDSRPLWITVWGGANTLAQALLHVRETRSPAAVDRFVSKLRVYSISDQDDAGPWIRREFPGLSYIVKPSTPNGEEYSTATWTGIAGDRFYLNGDGADFTTVTNEWLDENIRSKGPLGQAYPQYLFIMEGDTPSFLSLVDNGLASYRSPSWGGWGGRYVHRQPYGETRPIWTQGGDAFARDWSKDTVVGVDGDEHTSDQATIWRWREAFQHDFAARMDWTIKSYRNANHNPRARVNGVGGTDAVTINARVGESVTLDARGTDDPDGDRVRARWFVYREAGALSGVSRAQVTLRKGKGSSVVVTPTSTCPPFWLPEVQCRAATGQAHVILAVTDDGKPRLTSYRRVVLNVQAAAANAAKAKQRRRGSRR